MFLKHLRLIPSYFRVGLKVNTEYKFQLYTNIISRFLDFAVWLVFWFILTTELPQIQSWNTISLIALVAFFQVHINVWQLCFYSLGISHDIMRGDMDKYMVRPIQPVFGMIFERFQVMSLVPLIFSLIVLVVISVLYSSMAKLLVGLLVVLLSVLIIHFAYISLSFLAFWYGKIRPIISLYRSLRSVSTYPVSILPKHMMWIFILIFPAMFMGTAPALILFQLSWIEIFSMLFLAILVTALWIALTIFLWIKGVKRYESFGG